MNWGVDPTQIEGYARCLREAPKLLFRNLAVAYQQIVRYDVDKLRSDLPGKFNIRSKGLDKSFKAKATDPNKATSADKLFGTEYTGWKAAKVFETGGTITGKGKQLTIMFDAGRNANGRRKYTQKKLRQLVASGKVSFVPTPRGVLIIEHFGGLTKKGKPKKGTRDVILGMLKKSVNEKKRLDFYANAKRNESMHQDILDTAVENTLVEIRANTGK